MTFPPTYTGIKISVLNQTVKELDYWKDNLDYWEADQINIQFLCGSLDFTCEFKNNAFVGTTEKNPVLLKIICSDDGTLSGVVLYESIPSNFFTIPFYQPKVGMVLYTKSLSNGKLPQAYNKYTFIDEGMILKHIIKNTMPRKSKRFDIFKKAMKKHN